MTLSADTRPDDDGKAIVGKAIEPLPETPGVDPFVAGPSKEAAAPRGLRTRLLDYSAHAAMIVGLVGFAWTVGAHVVHRQTASTEAPATIASATPNDPLSELRTRNHELSATVHALQARLDALQVSVGDQGKVAAQVRVLQAGLDNVKTSLGTARGEQSAALARLDGKIDKLGHAPATKMQGLVDRLGRIEHGAIDTAPTASLPHPDAETRTGETRTSETRNAGAKQADAKQADTRQAGVKNAAVPVPRPTDLARGKGTDKGSEMKVASAEGPAKPPVLSNWVVRDVYQGVALLEGRRGTLEVVPGVSIPGAGVVKSIDRHGGGWTVTTTKGVVAYAAPPRETHRADPSGYYYGNGDRYDF